MKLISLLLLLLSMTQTYAKEIKAHKTQTEINIDGIIAEPEWLNKIFQSGFIQMEPDRGEPSREITRVAVQFDDKNIYVAIICEKSYPEPIVARQSRRDQLEKRDDVVVVALDTYHDSRSAFLFMTNALNTQVDVRISDDGKYLDTNWDTGWQVKTKIIENGWAAEFAIPFKSIRFDPNKTTWGINFGRFIPGALETSYWAGTTDMAGIDFEYRYKNNITGNLTYNPDFATVEGDREKINMTRWELSFPEKRKFFLEGGELFKNRIKAFYSRRIGEINFGGKAIGKTGPYTFAVIGANAKAIADNPLSSRDESFPKYNLGVVRIKRDVLKSSTIGMMIVDKEWQGSYNRVVSLDGVFHFPKEFHFTTQFVAGSPGPLKKNFGGFVRLARENNIYHYHLRYTQLAENFKESVNGIGFIRDDNRHELDSAVEYKWWIKRSGIEFFKYFSNYNIYWAKTSGTLRSWEIVQEAELYLANKFSASIDFSRDYQLFEKGFDNFDLELALGHNTEEWSATELSYQFGRNFDRDYWMVTGETRFKVHDKLSVEYELRKLNFNPDADNESTWLNIATLNYQFTPDLFVRLFAQHRSANDRVYIYGLFGWRFKLPNSAIYFVYTREDFDRIGLTRKNNEIFFLKLAYDFSL